MKMPIAGAILRALVAGADLGFGGALRVLRGTHNVLAAVERGIGRGYRKIPSLQGFRNRIGGEDRSAHHGESIAEDQAAWARYRAQQEDRWFT